MEEDKNTRKREELKLAARFLRSLRDCGQAEMAAAAQLNASGLSRLENGKTTPRPATMERLAAAAGVPMWLVGVLMNAIRLARAAQAAGPSATPVSPQSTAALERALVDAMQAALSTLLIEVGLEGEPTSRTCAPSEADRLLAADQWARFAPCSPAEQRLLVETSQEFRTWSFSERLCGESEHAAANDAALALHLANLALRVAKLVTGEAAWRSRLEGYAWAFIANARRVAGDLRAAEAACATAWILWKEGAGTDLRLLAEWRLSDLEASLWRDQRKFSAALESVGRALAAAPPTEAARILLKRATILEQAGEPEASIATLREAAPLVGDTREPRLRWALDFTLIVNLCHLGRYPDAESRLPELITLTEELANELDRLRVLWLTGRVAAAQGRNEEARTALSQVRQEFTLRRIGYDTALVTLELAELNLHGGRVGQVRQLAQETTWVFNAQDVHQGASAALRLFCQAAIAERATAEMARHCLVFLERSRYDPQLRFRGL
jgi:transcriptional regulator with XRE-family HTH domain